MEYRVDDRSLSGETFHDFVQQVWPGAYNLEQTRAALETMAMPEVDYFLETFMDSFSLTLDELK